MKTDDVIKFIQQHFTDGLVIVVGSGLSLAEGIPGMSGIADYLKDSAKSLVGADLVLWKNISASLDAKMGLEAALQRDAPSATLETWIIKKTCELLLPAELATMDAVIRGNKTLKLTTFLNRVLRPSNGLPILTTNYDRLTELACEMAGFHVDTTVTGHYAGKFDYARSSMASCKGVMTRGKVPMLDHFPRAVVLKPHGSFDWYRHGGDQAIRSSVELSAERLIITPGLNKYKAGYDVPFDKHRELANNFIDRAARFLVIGYGFNDDHLQKHLEPRIRNGVPTLILTHTATAKAEQIAKEASQCVCISKPKLFDGINVIRKNDILEERGSPWWDIETLTEELLV